MSEKETKIDEQVFAHVGCLSKMIDYQESSVVSKTVVKKKNGTVTLFAFDKDQGLSEHTAPFDAMVEILDGKAEVRIEDEVFEVASGEMIILPASKPHSVSAPERFKMLLTMIRES